MFLAVSADLSLVKDIDLGALSVHPACVVSVMLTSIQGSRDSAESLLVNVCGRLFLLQLDQKVKVQNPDNPKMPMVSE